MKSAVERVHNEVKQQEEKNSKLQDHLVVLREILVSMFKDVPLPETDELPTVDTIDNYMGRLQLTISNEPSKHPELLLKVAEIAKQLEVVLKPKVVHESLSLSGDEGVGGNTSVGE